MKCFWDLFEVLQWLTCLISIEARTCTVICHVCSHGVLQDVVVGYLSEKCTKVFLLQIVQTVHENNLRCIGSYILFGLPLTYSCWYHLLKIFIAEWHHYLFNTLHRHVNTFFVFIPKICIVWGIFGVTWKVCFFLSKLVTYSLKIAVRGCNICYWDPPWRKCRHREDVLYLDWRLILLCRYGGCPNLRTRKKVGKIH